MDSLMLMTSVHKKDRLHSQSFSKLQKHYDFIAINILYLYFGCKDTAKSRGAQYLKIRKIRKYHFCVSRNDCCLLSLLLTQIEYCPQITIGHTYPLIDKMTSFVPLQDGAVFAQFLCQEFVFTAHAVAHLCHALVAAMLFAKSQTQIGALHMNGMGLGIGVPITNPQRRRTRHDTLEQTAPARCPKGKESTQRAATQYHRTDMV